MMSSKDFIAMFLGVVFFVGAVAFFMLVVGLIGCESDGCTKEDTRCEKQILQVCNEDNNWDKHWMDCSELENEDGTKDWVCCENTDAGAACRPQDECPK